MLQINRVVPYDMAYHGRLEALPAWMSCRKDSLRTTEKGSIAPFPLSDLPV